MSAQPKEAADCCRARSSRIPPCLHVLPATVQLNKIHRAAGYGSEAGRVVMLTVKSAHHDNIIITQICVASPLL